MSIVLFLVFGWIVGLLARAIMPGKQPMSLIMTSLLGVAGSFVGGALSAAVFHHDFLSFRTTGLIGSVVGALIVLAIAGLVKKDKK
ncbi:MAG: GlsB/YeaQ/YmgE family stress response membrane protein [Polyangiaceae bacterium]